MKHVKVGIIGFGFMGTTHWGVYRGLGNAKVVAIADVDPAKRGGDISKVVGNIGGGDNSKPLDLTGVKTYAEANDLIADPEVEIVDVWRRAPNFRGAYFGHDHVNFVDGVTTDGVRLGVTKTMSECAYNDKDLGLRVFRLHADGTYETDTVSERFPKGMVNFNFNRINTVMNKGGVES